MVIEAKERNDNHELLEELYDLTPEPNGNELPPLNDDLTEEEIEEAALYAQLKCGVMLVTGEPGSGKDTFTHFLLWKLRVLFKDFKVMLDKKPRLLFGKYIPFNQHILMNEFKRLDENYKTGEISVGRDFAQWSKHKDRLNPLMERWLGDNDDLFYNTGIGLNEFWRYFYNRAPHNPMNKAISPLFKRYRHHNLLVLGITPHKEELDVKSCLQYATHEVRCSQTASPGIHKATIYQCRYFSGTSVLEIANTAPITLWIDGLAPQKRLGGKCVYDLFNSYERGESVPSVRLEE